MVIDPPTRVLVVDDDEPLIEVILSILEPLGFELSSTNRGGTALQLLAKNAYDLVISDLVMPGIDGQDLIDAMRARGDKTAILFLSGSGKVSEVVKLMKSGASSYLEKPFDPRELKREVLNILAELRRTRGTERTSASSPAPASGISLSRSGSREEASSNGESTDGILVTDISAVEGSAEPDVASEPSAIEISVQLDEDPSHARVAPPLPAQARQVARGSQPPHTQASASDAPARPGPPPLRRPTPQPASFATQISAPDEHPAQLGRYSLLGVLAAGGMGKVYRAHDPNLDRNVALKVIIPPSSAQEREEFVTRFRREAVALAKLRHPHIVTIFDTGVDKPSGMPYLVMELVDGRSLSRVLDEEGPLPVDRALYFAEQIGDALAFAHQHGIVHRDVKPDNVLVDAKDCVRLIDFGVARTEDSDVTMARILVGTPSYLSPEAAAGGRVDWRADQFSLATLILQMLSGKRVFRGDGVPHTVRNVREQHPPTLRELGMSNAPDGLQDLLLKMHAKDPNARYQNEQDVLAGLRAARARSVALRGETSRRLTLAQREPSSACSRDQRAARARARLAITPRAATSRAKLPPSTGTAPGTPQPPASSLPGDDTGSALRPAPRGLPPAPA